MFEHGERMGGMAGARTHLAITEGYVHALVQAVLDGSV
jgi:hypothetical protein